jgi:hypothetical protein
MSRAGKVHISWSAAGGTSRRMTFSFFFSLSDPVYIKIHWAISKEKGKPQTQTDVQEKIRHTTLKRQ